MANSPDLSILRDEAFQRAVLRELSRAFRHALSTYAETLELGGDPLARPEGKPGDPQHWRAALVMRTVRKMARCPELRVFTPAQLQHFLQHAYLVKAPFPLATLNSTLRSLVARGHLKQVMLSEDSFPGFGLPEYDLRRDPVHYRRVMNPVLGYVPERDPRGFAERVNKFLREEREREVKATEPSKPEAPAKAPRKRAKAPEATPEPPKAPRKRTKPAAKAPAGAPDETIVEVPAAPTE